ncbi:MAG: hypothetical protein H6741_15310 [Alphaproteobacteria bacterium]|nr:hypothetical protein [Alphaproteobacteria bacterium]
MSRARRLALALLLAAGALLPEAVRADYDRASAEDFDAFLAFEDRRARFRDFEASLIREGVGEVVPPWQLWRQGTDFRSLGEPAFAEPPAEQLGNIVSTLKLLRDEVIPRVGPVEVLSGYRTERYNSRAGGSAGSRHKWFQAVDVLPERPWARAELHTELLSFWSTKGSAVDMGLGLYGGTRFHVDTWRYRRW